MYTIDGKYGNVHIEGKSINIEKIPIEELNKYLKILKHNQEKLIEKQNQYLSQILR